MFEQKMSKQMVKQGYNVSFVYFTAQYVYETHDIRNIMQRTIIAVHFNGKLSLLFIDINYIVFSQKPPIGRGGKIISKRDSFQHSIH